MQYQNDIALVFLFVVRLVSISINSKHPLINTAFYDIVRVHYYNKWRSKMKKRVDKVNYYLDIAETVLERGTCIRRNFGAIIVNNDEIISSGKKLL